MKRILASILAVAACTAALTGCSSSSPSNSVSTPTPSSGGNTSAGTSNSAQPPSSSAVSTSEPVELSLCMSQIRWGVSVDDGHMQKFTEQLEKSTNTKIEMIAPTHNDYMEKLNVLLASGDYPDIFIPQQAWDYVGQFANRGYLIPLTKYINDDARFAAAKTTDLTMYQSGDDIYGLPLGKGNTKIFWFRKDMVDKYSMNIKDSMTTDEFIAELSKVDKSETIPFSFPKHISNFQIFNNAFGAYGGILTDANGVYYDGIQTQEMKDAFAFIKSLYDQGLMDSEFITNENSNMREKIYTGKTASDVDYYGRYLNYCQSSESVEKATDFIPCFTLVGPNGTSGNLNESGNEAACISVKCKNPDAAMDVLYCLFFTEEGRMLYTTGVEGVHYDIKDGVLTPREDAAAAGYTVNVSDVSAGWPNIDVAALPFSFEGVTPETLKKNNDYINKALSPEYVGPIVKIPMGKSTLYDENVATYTSNLYEMATKIVLGSQTIDEAYADYEKFWKSIQGDKMLDELNGK